MPWWSFHSTYSTSSETCIVPCTVPPSSKWNWRSVCMTPRYILERKRRRIEMKWDPAGTSTQNATLLFLWFCHTGRGREREREPECVSHLCDTQRSRLLAGLTCFRLLRQLTCQAWGSWSSACAFPFIYSAFYLNPLSPSVFQLIRSYFFWVSLLFSSQFIPDYSFGNIFASFVSLSCFCFIPACPLSLSPSLCLLLSWVDSVESGCISVQVTVRRVSEVWLICCLLTVLQKLLSVEEHGETWLHFGPATLNRPVASASVERRSMCLPWMCIFVSVETVFPGGQRSAE